MQDERIADLLNGKVDVGTDVTVKGWVRTRRDSSAGFSFIDVNDGSSLDNLQIIAGDGLDNYEAEVQKLTAGCSVVIEGELVESQGGGQDYEIQASSVDVLGWVDDPETYPMQPKRHSMEHLREHAHLRMRTNLIGALTRVRNSISMAIHRYFQENGFYWIHTPIITANDAEGAGDMFRVTKLDVDDPPRRDGGGVDFSKDFFGRSTFLTVSGQLNVETYAMAMSRVYTFGPTFRAENSHTRRHLAEFWMVEPEIAFADLTDDVALAEDFLKYISAAVLDDCADDMENLFDKYVDKGCIARLEALISTDFETMQYGEAIDRLKASGEDFDFPVEWGKDLQSEHEKYLTDEVVGGPVAVVNWPEEIKAFYMRRNDDGKTVAAMDVLAPGIGEIIGGSQREDRLDVLDERITAHGLEPEDYWWYRDLRRYGSTPHAGFGLGLERMIQYATGVDNIREVIPFPRAPNNAEF